MGNRIANIVGLLLTVLIVLVAFAIQQSWSSATDTQKLREEVSVHCTENKVREDWLKSTLEEMKSDIKDIKKQLNSRGFLK